MASTSCLAYREVGQAWWATTSCIESGGQIFLDDGGRGRGGELVRRFLHDVNRCVLQYKRVLQEETFLLLWTFRPESKNNMLCINRNRGQQLYAQYRQEGRAK